MLIAGDLGSSDSMRMLLTVAPRNPNYGRVVGFLLLEQMAADSEPVFALLVASLGADDALKTKLDELRIRTMSQLAFRSKGPPGQVSGTEFEDSVLKPLLAEADAGKAAIVRRLYLEAYTTVLSESKSKAEGKDDAKHFIPENDKAARLLKLAKDRPGVQTTGEHEPAAKLVDRIFTGVKTLNMPYVAWTLCLSRSEELQGRSKAALARDSIEVRADASGILYERPAVKDAPTDLSSDFRVHLALHRRGVAMHLAGAVDFDTHRVLTDKLFKHYLELPPPGCERITLSQLKSADEWIWTELASHVRQGLQPDGTQTFPADAELLRLLALPGFELRLQPLRRVLHEDRPAKMARTDDGPKGKGKGTPGNSCSSTNARPPASMPAELKDHAHRTSQGQPICFAFQLGNCPLKNKKPGQRCARGWHVCAFKMPNGQACGLPHSLKDHH